MMKKGLVLVFAAACLLFVSCKSKPKKNSKTPAAAEVSETAETSEGTESTEGSGKSEDNKSSEDSVGTVLVDKNSAKTKAKKTKIKDINEIFGIIQLKMKGKYGSYSISLVNDLGKKVPVISTANEYTTNAFYLKSSQKTICLTTDGSVKSSLEKKQDGVSILYSVPNYADVTVDFKTLSTDKKSASNMLKVVATVTNRSKRNDDFHLKAILDTVLGESDSYHFYTCEGVSIKNEVMYRTLQNQKWFISKNTAASMQMFFSGADCTVPALVAFANYSTLEKNSWEPDMNSFRAFDTVLSYNNSAVCAIWNPLKLAVGESGKVVFYLAFGVDGAKPEGEKIIYAEEEKKQEELSPVELVKDVRTDRGYSFVTETIEAPVTIQPEPVAETPSYKVPSVDFYIQNITPEHLSNEYIQSLLDRIAALEENSPTLNRQEIMELNAELDAILTYLGQ